MSVLEENQLYCLVLETNLPQKNVFIRVIIHTYTHTHTNKQKRSYIKNSKHPSGIHSICQIL